MDKWINTLKHLIISGFYKLRYEIKITSILTHTVIPIKQDNKKNTSFTQKSFIHKKNYSHNKNI